MSFTEGIFLLIVMNCVTEAGSEYCSWSNQTLSFVTSCPETKTGVAKRAALKNCESLAFIQNCTEPTKYKYHCVMNEFQNALVEVCAPSSYILGFCTEYNTYGAVIQSNYRLKCSNIDPPCADRYLSSDAYHYKGCYEIVKNHIKKEVSDLQPQPHHLQNTSEGQLNPRESSDRNYVIIIGICSVFIITTFTIGGVLLRMCKTRKFELLNGREIKEKLFKSKE